MLAAALLMPGCERTGLQGSVDGGTPLVGFLVEEEISDFRLKSTSAALRGENGEELHGTYNILVSEESLSGNSAYSADIAGDTKAARIYKGGDVTSSPSDITFKAWAYNMNPSDAAASAWLLDAGTGTTPASVAYSTAKKMWLPNTDISFSNRGEGWYTRWFAIAPASAAAPVPANGVSPTLTYTVSESDVTKHVDLMVAAPSPRLMSDKTTVGLNFVHVLTGVRFKKDPGINVKSVTVSGFYDRATLDMASLPADGNLRQVNYDTFWSGHTMTKTTPSITAGGLDAASQWASDTIVNGKVMMMIPQWLPDEAKISVVIAEDGGDTTLESSISGHMWLPGRMVTYRIKGDKLVYEFETEELMSDNPADGNGASIYCRTHTEGGYPRPDASWSVEGIYSTLAGARDADATKKYGAASGYSASRVGTTEKISVTFAAAAPVTQPSSYFLTLGTDGGAESGWRGAQDAPWNLANPAGGGKYIKESANCYIINDPGYYRIPLVAGNGIVNGIINADAFEKHNATNFVDYKNKPVNAPYLHQTHSGSGVEYVPTTACIVWAEADMIESLEGVAASSGNSYEIADAITYDGDLYWLNFRIPASKIAPGCAVIAVKDDEGIIMWSWMLWVTDYEPAIGGGTVTCQWGVNSSETVSFMTRNLGWTVDGNISCNVPKEWAYVRVVCDDDNSVAAVVKVRRPSSGITSLPRTGHAPYYQWGRKDPILWANGCVSYGTDTNFSTQKTGTEYNLLIQNPGTRYPVGSNNTGYPLLSGANSTLAGIWNWWSADATFGNYDMTTVKTIYDPSPAGFTVPRHNAFNGFSTTSATWYGSDGVGYLFPNGYRQSGTATIFLPACGRRQGSGALAVVGEWGNYWVAVPQGDNTGRRFVFGADGVFYPRPNDSDTGEKAGLFSKAGALSIRPAAAE